MSSITLKMLAKTLGLSISTVSKALKEHQGISKETIKRVKEIAEALNYEPNATAVNLKKQDSRLFAVLVPNFCSFYSSFLEGLEEECRRENYNLMILKNNDDIEVEKQNLKLCRLNRVTGAFICMCTNSADYSDYNKTIDSGIPVLFFDKIPKEDNYNKISINDEKAAAMAAEYLQQKKVKKVLAFFGNKKLSITSQRQKSFENTINKTGVSVTYVHASSTPEAELLCSKIKNIENYDGIFFMSDEVLIGAMQILKHKKEISNNSIHLVCLTDGQLPNLYQSQIASVLTSGNQLAKKSFKAMLEILSERNNPKEYFVEPQLLK